MRVPPWCFGEFWSWKAGRVFRATLDNHLEFLTFFFDEIQQFVCFNLNGTGGGIRARRAHLTLFKVYGSYMGITKSQTAQLSPLLIPRIIQSLVLWSQLPPCSAIPGKYCQSLCPKEKQNKNMFGTSKVWKFGIQVFWPWFHRILSNAFPRLSYQTHTWNT